MLFRILPLSLDRKVQLDALPYPAYAWGVYSAARQAHLLGLSSLSVIEFGVAGGRGLRTLEDLAKAVELRFGVRVELFGFDTGAGLPPPRDFRDTPYVYREELFSMDPTKLHLTRAELLLGDVAETVPRFLQRTVPPIGFVSFDLDYYSSTRDAIRVLEDADLGRYLPRTLLYFDDLFSDEDTYRSEFVGEQLAIGEFNQRNTTRKVAVIHGLRHSRVFPAAWNDAAFVCHFFEHPHYSTYIGALKSP